MNLKAVHRYPFLRMLIPLLLGIGCSDGLFFYTHWILPDSCYLLLLFPLALILIHRFTPSKRETILFGLFLNMGLFFTGALITYNQLQRHKRADDARPHTYLVEILETPVYKDKSICCKVEAEHTDSCRPTSFQALLYFQKDSCSLLLKEGERLAVTTRITLPSRNGVPCEFDYGRYLLHQHLSGTGYVPATQREKLSDPDSTPSLRHLISLLRQKTWDLYHRLGIEGDNYQVLTALTTGYKEELSDELEQTYSRSGASHLLAISGLHVGLIYALIICFLNFFRFFKSHRWIRSFTVILLLSFFALFTGMSPSVVRAVVMTAIFLIADTLERGQRPGNSLFIAAFLMLLVRPLWLFEVGFQLSFCAVAGILLFTPPLNRLVHPRYRIIRNVWQMICVSLAAQIGTLPLVGYYFGQMPLYFLLTNLIAIPLATGILYAAIALLLLSPCPFLVNGMAKLTDTLLTLQHLFLDWVSNLPGSVIKHFYLYPTDVIAYAVILYLIYHFWHCRTARNYCITTACLSFFLLLHLVQQYQDKPDTSIRCYNLQGVSAIACTESDAKVWMVYPTGAIDSLQTTRQLRRHWDRQQVTPAHVASPFEGHSLILKNNLVLFHNTSLLFLNSATWQATMSEPLHVDYLYLSKGFQGSLHELQATFQFHEIIVDRSLSTRQTRQLLQECRQNGIKITDLTTKGYLHIVV